MDLTKGGEDIDAVAELSDGRLLISTTANVNVTGITEKVQDRDLLAFTITTYGETTSGTWEYYFDGSDVEMGSGSEDINGVFAESDATTLHLSTRGKLNTTGFKARAEDLFVFAATGTGSTTTGTFNPTLMLDGSETGMNKLKVDALHIGQLLSGARASRSSGNNAHLKQTQVLPPILDIVQSATLNNDKSNDDQANESSTGRGSNNSLACFFIVARESPHRPQFRTAHVDCRFDRIARASTEFERFRCAIRIGRILAVSGYNWRLTRTDRFLCVFAPQRSSRGFTPQSRRDAARSQ